MHQSSEALRAILAEDPELKKLLVLSLQKAGRENPDPKTNPVRDLEDYYAYLDRADEAVPWEKTAFSGNADLPETIDQAMAYFFFLLDQPLEELAGRGYFYPSVQYEEKLKPWVRDVFRKWGAHLSAEESWNADLYRKICAEPSFKMDRGWYEAPENWHSFNDFFSRKLSSPHVRPIEEPGDDAAVVSPADSEFQGVWEIDASSRIAGGEGAAVKSGTFRSVGEILGPKSGYRDAFAGGRMTHTFLSLTDYHRYHFPVSGVIREVGILPGYDAAGGIMRWDKKNRRYNLELGEPEWQSIETRGCVILETQKYGLTALLPIAMCQVSSVNFTDHVRVGQQVEKGEELGFFLFGGSDFMMLFQERAGFVYTVPKEHPHLLTGRVCGRFRG